MFILIGIGIIALGMGAYFFFSDSLPLSSLFSSQSSQKLNPVFEQVALTACQNITVPGNYEISMNLTASGNCFNVTVSDVLIDGQGFIISGNGSFGYAGILANNRINLTVKNLRITNFSRGFIYTGVTNSSIINNTLFFNGRGVQFSGASRFNQIVNNTINNSNGEGILFEGTSSNNQIINNIIRIANQGFILSPGNNEIINNIIVSPASQGIQLSSNGNSKLINNTVTGASIALETNTINNEIINNTLNGNSIGLRFLSGANNNNVTGNIINSNTFRGINIITASNNKIINNSINSNLINIELDSGSLNNVISGGLINNSGSSAISLIAGSNNNNITNVLITNTNPSFFDIDFDSVNGTYLIDMSLNNYSFTGLGGTIKVKSSQFGEIKFIQPVNGSGNNLSANIIITNNSAFVNSLRIGLNRSANITLFGLPTTLTNPRILRDGIECTSITSPSCINLTNLNAGNVTFNVSSWSNYSIGADVGTAITACGNLEMANTIYVLTTNVSTTGTCFNITANNIVLNGAGFNINGDGGSGDNGVLVSGLTNITIKNLNITNFGRGIFFEGNVINSTVLNNIILNSSDRGIILLSSSNNNLVVNNSILVATTDGILLTISSNYNIIRGNTVSNSSLGIHLSSSSHNILDNNTALYHTNGIHSDTSHNNTITNNVVNFNSNTGIDNGASNNNTITNNVVNFNTNRGIHLYSNGDNNIVVNNTVSNSTLGIHVNGTSDNNQIIGNIVRNNSDIGIKVTTNTNNTIKNNIVNNNSGHGIALETSTNNTIINNNASSNGQSGIQLAANSNGNLIRDNIANNNINSGASAGIGLLSFSNNNTILNNTVNSNSKRGILLSDSDNNLVINNTANSNLQNGININIGKNNTITNLIINNSGQNAILIEGPDSVNNNFTNVTVTNTNSASYDINILNAGINNTYLIDTFLANYSFNQSKVNFKSSNFGEIRFLQAINGTGNNLSNDIQIRNNFVSVNSSIIGLNRSANITLYNLPTTFNNPVILRDGVVCPANICTALTSLNAGNVTFNVTGWSNYSITEGPDISFPQINFTSPTPANGTITSNTSVTINVSLIEPSLDTFIWNWNGTNYTFYNNSLVLINGFNNLSALGENATKVVDVSLIDGNNGTLIGGTSYNASGKYGTALQFDGFNDYVNYTRIPALEGASAQYTISLWVRKFGTTGSQMIYNYDDDDAIPGAGQETYMFWSTTMGVVRFNPGGSGAEISTAITDLNDANWHRITVSKNATAAMIYEDGILRTTQTTTSLTGSAAHKLRLGFPLNMDHWNGTMDEFRIWNRSLTATEVQQDYFSNLFKNNLNDWYFYSNQSNLSFSNYNYFACAKDNSNNTNCTETRTIILQNTAPQIVNLTESPTDPATYASGQIYRFNATVFDNEGNLQSIRIEFNGTNFTVAQSQTPNVFNFTIANLAAGTYNYYWSANDSLGLRNVTAVQNYTINKATGVVQTHIDNQRANKLVVSGTNVLLNGTLINGTGNIELFRNGTLINSGASPLSNLSLFSAAGVFNITTLYAGNQNFTSAFETWFVTVGVSNCNGNFTTLKILEDNNLPRVQLCKAIEF